MKQGFTRIDFAYVNKIYRYLSWINVGRNFKSMRFFLYRHTCMQNNYVDMQH